MARFLLLLLATASVSCREPGLEEFSFDPGPEWNRAAVVNGWEYRPPAGEPLTLRAFLDPLMDQTVLFSQQTRRNIRENYEETYRVEDDHVYFTSLTVSGREALVVFFADRSSGSLVHRRQYYLVDGHRVFVISAAVGRLSSKELDALVARFRF